MEEEERLNPHTGEAVHIQVIPRTSLAHHLPE